MPRRSATEIRPGQDPHATTPVSGPGSRRELITGAAIETLAAQGMRGLTHRAVDEAAGLAAGSTSYYFRTREALLQATVERLAELSTADLAGFQASVLAGPVDPEHLAGAVTAVLTRWLTVDRQRVVARYELSLEATRRPGLREVLATSGGALRAAVADVLGAAGAPDPGRAAVRLVACLDGLIFDQVAGAGPPLPAGELRAAVAGLLRLALANPQA